jgi:hypothetical protein
VLHRPVELAAVIGEVEIPAKNHMYDDATYREFGRRC